MKKKKKNKGDSKNFQKLVRHRMEKTGESYSIARAKLTKKRVEVASAGHVLVGDGRLVPHREVRYRPGADREQIFKALFGPDWRPPTERCPKCHDWISYDGFCQCNAHERSMEITHTVTFTPFDSPRDDGAANDDPVRKILQGWMDLPEVPAATADDECYLAAKVGRWLVSAEKADETGLYVAEPFGPEHIALGTIKLEVDGGGWRTYRLPAELGVWACEQVENATEGKNQFPAFFALHVTDETYEVRLSSLRAT